ncbi:hypothetical protein DER29_4708 [Micromonospora sp. M71_S20]|nr:hypothetical protein DER29_4708 [Micromonospora sp. M71_S20]
MASTLGPTGRAPTPEREGTASPLGGSAVRQAGHGRGWRQFTARISYRSRGLKGAPPPVIIAAWRRALPTVSAVEGSRATRSSCQYSVVAITLQ